MAVVGTAEVIVRPNTAGFATALKEQTDPALAQTEASVAASGQRMGTGLKKGLEVGAAGFTAVIAGAVDLESKFQEATTSIAANANISAAAASKIGDAFLATAGHSIYSATTIANAYAPVAGQLGAVEGHALSAAQATTIMAASSNLAEGANIQLGTATQDLANVMQAYHQSVGQASADTDVLFNTSRQTGFSVDTLTSTLDRMHAKLGELTPSLANSGALLLVMAQNGITGRSAMSGLSTGMTTLLGTSSKTTDMVKTLGLQLYNSQGQFVGMQSVIAQLTPKFDELNPKMQAMAAQALFGTSAWKQMLPVVLAGPAAFDSATAAVSRHGAAQSAAEVQSHTFGHELDVTKAAAIDMGIQLGTVVMPVITEFIGWITDATSYLSAHKTVLEAVAATLTGVLGVAFTAFTVNKISGFVSSVKDATNTVSGLVKALTGPLTSAFGAAGDGAAKAATATQTGMGKVETAVSDAQGPVAKSSTAIGDSLAGGLKTGVATGATDVTAGLATIESGVSSEATAFATAGAVDGAAIDTGIAAGMEEGQVALDTEAATIGDAALAAMGPIGLLIAGTATIAGLLAAHGNDPVTASSGYETGTTSGGQTYVVTPRNAAPIPGGKTGATPTLKPGPGTDPFTGAAAGGFTSTVSDPATSFATSFLQQAGAPVSAANVAAIKDLFSAEEGGNVLVPGHGGTNNPFEIAGNRAPGYQGAVNGDGVASYATPQEGVQAALNYFQQTAGISDVIGALKANQGVASVEQAFHNLGPVAFGSDTASPWAGPTAATGPSSIYGPSPGHYGLMSPQAPSTNPQLNRDVAGAGGGTAAGGGGGGGASSAATAAAAAKIIDADTKAGMAALKTSVTDAHTKGLAQLDKELTSTHTSQMVSLVQKLDATHNSKLEALAGKIEANYKTALEHQASLIDTDTKEGNAALSSLVGHAHESSLALLTGKVSDIHSKSLGELDTMLDKTHTDQLASLVGKLNATHNSALMGMATKIETAYQAAETQRTAILSADTKTGQGELNNLLNATTSGSLTQLNTELDATHTQKMENLVQMLEATHSSKLEKLGTEIFGAYKGALTAQTTAIDQAATDAATASAQAATDAATAAAQAATAAAQVATDAYNASVASINASNAAASAATQAAAGLFGAGVTLGVNTPVQADAAQIATLTSASPGQLAASLPNVIGMLESGSGVNYAALAVGFGQDSVIGQDFTKLASGTLNPADQAALLATTEGLVEQLVTLTGQWTSDTAAAAAAATVPAMASGGIVRRPMLALLGEKEDEAVIPLSKLGGPAVMGGQPSPLPAWANKMGGAGPAAPTTLPNVPGLNVFGDINVTQAESSLTELGQELMWQIKVGALPAMRGQGVV